MPFGLSKGERTSAALIDITSSSVGGALADLGFGEQPTLHYLTRAPIEAHDGEEPSLAMLRTLGEVSDVLISEGAPVLRQATKSGKVDRIFVSVGAPWQATTVRTEQVSETKPFLFTKAFLAEVIRKSSAVKEGYTLSGESVVATLLNGYEVAHPFGKKVDRAEMIVLSSLIKKDVADDAEKVLRKAYHTHSLSLTAFAPIVYTVFRDLFPHERDFLIVDVSGEATDIAFVKRNLLVDVASEPHGVNELMRKAHAAAKVIEGKKSDLTLTADLMPNAQFTKEVESSQRSWLDALTATLRDFATRNALPRTLFLLADDASRDYLKNLLDSETLRSLWLTDEPLAILPVLPSQCSAFVTSRAAGGYDLYLSLLALFARRQLTG